MRAGVLSNRAASTTVIVYGVLARMIFNDFIMVHTSIALLSAVHERKPYNKIPGKLRPFLFVLVPVSMTEHRQAYVQSFKVLDTHCYQHVCSWWKQWNLQMRHIVHIILVYLLLTSWK